MNNNNKNSIKKIINPGELELAFCDLRQNQPRSLNIPEFNSGIPIIIVKKKNGFNQPSNYYAIKMPDPTILAEGIGKSQFYENLDNLKKNNPNDENKILAIKLQIFFKLYWGNEPPFSKEFYDLNAYFMSKTL